MGQLIFILITIALLGGFYGLVLFEEKKGVRFIAPERARFDRFVERLLFIYHHVDFAAFLRDEVRSALHRLGHNAAALTLHAVRAIERVLTRLVRYLRTHHAAIDMQPRENAREFVRTLSEFKGQLQATHPEVPGIQ